MERLQELAEELVRRDDPRLRAELLALAGPLADEVVAEFGDCGLEEEELQRAAHLGLIAAVYHPELARGLPFCEFGRNLMRGEIRARIRDRFPPPRPPHWLRLLSTQLDRALPELAQELGRPPTLEELGERLNLTEQGIKEAFKAREAFLYSSLSADRRPGDLQPEFHPELIRDRRPSPFPWQARIRLAQALDRLFQLWERIMEGLWWKKEGV
ncbi:TPA: hypothetical protein EYH33_05075 [Candidatus Bipolaricaulota bacterium]|nr:hypothetical protein [Candidatus Bipolaricaulota bacterium]